MLENDYRELEEVANIARPIDIVFTKANVVNLEEVKIIILNNALNSHPLLSILQVLEVEKVACYDFKEVITMSYMELDKVAPRSPKKISTTLILPYRVVELDVFNS